ncbi:MAG: efflux RND transporter periplasmic adaptor subunit [Bacteroidota bacterium]|nr:efflux RND transporter periplasmic adaptor subunit [Bacteroidota bacterium]
MYFKYFAVSLAAMLLTACNNSNPVDRGAEHEVLKVQYTVYSDTLELFAEADPLVTGTVSNVLSHFTTLSDFKPLASGTVTLKLTVNGQTVEETAENPIRRGIYSFNVTPAGAGKGTIEYLVRTGTGESRIIVPDVTVYPDAAVAEEDIEKNAAPSTNTTAFTKEQSWKIDFSTGYAVREPFGQVIRTMALVQPAQGNESVVSARSGGVVTFTGKTVLEGTEVASGQPLLSIRGSGFAEDNSAVRFTEAQNNYEQAKAEYDRALLLAADRIVSERQLLEAKTQFENARSVYENLQQNFSRTGQTVTSPMRGFVRQLLVENGQYVEPGQPLMVISQNSTLMLRAEVQPRYASFLNSINSATVSSGDDSKTYTLEELDGRIFSVGKASTADSYLIPVSVQVRNTAGFVPGSFVKLWLKTVADAEALTVPNSALIEEQGAFFVFVQVTPEKFEKRLVQTGTTDGIRTEVTGGLRDDERIVTKGAILVKLAQATGALDAHSGHVH